MPQNHDSVALWNAGLLLKLTNLVEATTFLAKNRPRNHILTILAALFKTFLPQFDPAKSKITFPNFFDFLKALMHEKLFT